MRNLKYPNLWHGCIGAWCPSQDNSRSTRLTDFSGYGNHGTLTNMDAASDWVVSGGRGALDFDGTNGYVQANKIAIITAFSVSFWINPASVAISNRMIIGEWSATNANRSWIISTENSFGSRIVFGTDSGSQNNLSRTTNNVLSVGTWQNYVAVFPGSYSLTLHLNGVSLPLTDVIKGSFAYNTTSTDPLTIGRQFGGASTEFQGQLDDIRIYNRSLTPSEIQLLARRRGIAYETTRWRAYATQGAAPAIPNRRSSSRFAAFPA